MKRKPKIVNGIASNVRAELTKFEAKELEKLIDHLEWHEYCVSGMRQINGGFAQLEAYEIDEDEDGEVVLMEMVTGEQDTGGGSSRQDTFLFNISRNLIKNKKMSTKQKAKKVLLTGVE